MIDFSKIDYNSDVGLKLRKLNQLVLGKKIKLTQSRFWKLASLFEDSEKKISQYHTEWEQNEKSIHNNYWNYTDSKLKIYSEIEFKTVQSFRTDTYFYDPDILVVPEGQTDARNAQIKQAILKKIWSVTKTRQECKKIVVDSLTSWGIGEMGYMEDHVNFDDLITIEEKMQLLESMINSDEYLNNREYIDGLLDETEKQIKESDGDLKKKVKWVDCNKIAGQPTFSRVNPKNFITDMSQNDPDKVQFRGKHYFLKLEDVQRLYPEFTEKHLSSHFENVKIIDMADLGSTEFTEGEQNAAYNEFRNDKKFKLDMIKIYKMYFYENDFMGQRRVAELLYTDIIKDEPISCKFCDLPYHKFPYITMDFIRVNDNQPAIPLLSKVKSNSTLKTIFLNKIMRLGNMYSRKILLPKSWITDKNMFNKINSAKNEYIGYEDRFGDNDIKQKIYEVNQDTSVLNLLIQLSGYVDAENEQIAKTSTRDRQGQGPDTTATQSVITENAAKRMTGMYISEIDEFSQQICEFQNLIVDAKYDSEDFVEIAGKDLSKDVVQYNIKDLYGLYRISIKYGSSSQQMRQLEAEQLLQSFATLYQSEFCVGQYKRNALVIFGRKTGWDDSEIDLMLMPSVREITPNDELYILMTSGQMPPPTDTEDFEFHLSEHELQKQNINGSQMLTDEQKVMVLKAIEQHIMMTEEMQSQADNKGKSIDTSGDKYSKHPKGIESGGKENKQISEATSPKEFVAEEK